MGGIEQLIGDRSHCTIKGYYLNITKILIQCLSISRAEIDWVVFMKGNKIRFELFGRDQLVEMLVITEIKAHLFNVLCSRDTI